MFRKNSARARRAAAPVSGAKPSHTLSIRTQLMLFLCCISLLLLGLVWFLCTRLLQPQYNRYIYRNLSTQADAVVAMMDEAIADGVVISSRDFGITTVNSDFTAQLNEAFSGGSINITNCCLDICDSTLFHVMGSENLYPCLIHNSTSLKIGGQSETERNTATAFRLRRRCFDEGSLYLILETASGSSQMVVGRTTADGQYAVLLSMSVARVAEAGIIVSKILPGVAAGVFALAFLAAWLFSRWFTKPLTQLSRAARQMAEGSYDIHVDTGRRDELGILAHDFDHMAGEVKRSAQLQRDLLANVSHDLRTPLTLIKGYAETVRDLTGGDKPRRDEQMNIIIDETDRLSALVNSVMELSKVSSGTDKCDPVRFDMSQLCEEVAERYEAVCAQNGWRLELDIPEDTPLNVCADPQMMERVLHNLLGNAMHHIGADGVFILRAKAAPDGVRVEVEDHGAGIRAEDLPYIFDRYYRSRSDAGKAGTGLGLSISKAIFQQHGFRFGVQSTPGRGTTFWFLMTDRAPALPTKS